MDGIEPGALRGPFFMPRWAPTPRAQGAGRRGAGAQNMITTDRLAGAQTSIDISWLAGAQTYRPAGRLAGAQTGAPGVAYLDVFLTI
jgi:hypothetical protein